MRPRSAEFYSGLVVRLTRASGRKIIKILEKNPNKDPDSYDEEDIAHMRKVVAYCKRHLAQEEKAKQDSNSKSYKSLKNWVSILRLVIEHAILTLCRDMMHRRHDPKPSYHARVALAGR